MYLDEFQTYNFLTEWSVVAWHDPTLRRYVVAPVLKKEYSDSVASFLLFWPYLMYFRDNFELFICFHFLTFKNVVPENMFCEVLQDLISSNRKVHTISHDATHYVKLVARNPDEEFDGVRFDSSINVGDGKMISVMKQVLMRAVLSSICAVSTFVYRNCGKSFITPVSIHTLIYVSCLSVHRYSCFSILTNKQRKMK
jgi:hypothetical protein